MTKGLWLIFQKREKDLNKYKEFDEIYLINGWTIYRKDEIYKYYKKLEKKGYKPYVVINFNEDGKFDEGLFFKRLKYWKEKNVNIMIDFIRFHSMKLENVLKMNQITRIVKKIYDMGINAELAVWKFPSCYLVGQNPKQLSKYSNKLHFMLYGSQPYSRKMTMFYIWVHRILFPKQIKAIPAWNMRKRDYEAYKRKVKNKFSVFRWETLNNLK